MLVHSPLSHLHALSISALSALHRDCDYRRWELWVTHQKADRCSGFDQAINDVTRLAVQPALDCE